MFWDGQRWVPDDGAPHEQTAPRRGRRFRDWLSTGVMLMVLAGLMVPFSGAFAAKPSGRVLLATWSDTADVVTYEEGNRAITYRGSWFSTYYDSYMGGKARSTDTSGSKASLRFKGTAVSWIGPIGPTRGSARVFVDGNLVKTVSAYNGSFVPTRVLFKRSWNSYGSHRIDIVSVGTDGHPTVALDAFLVRRAHPGSSFRRS